MQSEPKSAFTTRRGTWRFRGKDYATTEVIRARVAKPPEGGGSWSPSLPPAVVVGHVRLLEGGMYRWVAFPFGGAPLDCGDVATVAWGVEAIKEYVARVDRQVVRVAARAQEAA